MFSVVEKSLWSTFHFGRRRTEIPRISCARATPGFLSCSRLYGKTKATCNEYASRKSYKDRLFKHPIHTEFTKSYNRLYGRIRRGKLPEDTPLMDELKALHDEYYVKYENTHRQDREAVWREYMQKNKELLG